MWKRNLLLRFPQHWVGGSSSRLEQEGIGSVVSIRTQAGAAGARVSLGRVVALRVVTNTPGSPIPVGYGLGHGSKPMRMLAGDGEKRVW